MDGLLRWYEAFPRGFDGEKSRYLNDNTMVDHVASLLYSTGLQAGIQSDLLTFACST